MPSIADQLAAKGIMPSGVKKMLALAVPGPEFTNNGGLKWGHSAARNVLGWSLTGFGQIDLTLRNFRMSEKIIERGPNTLVKIFRRNGDTRPNNVEIRFTGEIEPGVVLLHAAGTTITDMGTVDRFPAFDVPVRWEEKDGETVPRTNARFGDDIDLVLVDTATGEVAVLEASVSIRGRQFWECLQHVFHGQFVELTAQEAEHLKLKTVEVDGRLFTAVPVIPENAYPGADFQTNFSDMGEAVTRYVAEKGYFKPLAEVEVATWEPQALGELPESMKNDGWIKAVVQWFNLVLGWGFALCEDGEPCMVHFAQMLDEDGKLISESGDMPTLQPMTGIAVKRERGKGGRGYKATAIRAP